MSSAGPGPADPLAQTVVTVFGRRAVLEALDSPHVEVSRVWWERGLPGSLREQLGQRCHERGIEGTRVSRSVLQEISRSPRHDQGVAARLRLLRVQALEGFLQQCGGSRASTPIGVLGLDGLTNSQNVGMLLRSALAAGMDAVLWPAVGTPWINGLVVKSSAAAAYACPIVRCSSIAEAAPLLQAAGFVLHGLGAETGADLFAHAPPHRAVYVLGSETRGLSPEVAALLDARLRIPIEAPVESLNAAVAGSLVAFHWATRQRAQRARLPEAGGSPVAGPPDAAP